MIYLAFLIFTFLVLLLAFYQWQFYMVFAPTYHREGDLCEKCSILTMQSDDGITLEGAIYESQDSQTTLLMFVGRSHDAVGLISKLSLTYPNARVIAFNYRSYGKSEGKVDEKNMYVDGLKIATLVEKNYGEFYLLGYSIGSSVASYVAAHHQVKKLFLVGAFNSIASLAKSKFVDRSFFPFIDLSKVFRYKFRTGEYVKSIEAPTYLFVSKSDRITYIENARELKENIKNLAEYRELDGLSHKEILWDERVTQKINRELSSQF